MSEEQNQNHFFQQNIPNVDLANSIQPLNIYYDQVREETNNISGDVPSDPIIPVDNYTDMQFTAGHVSYNHNAQNAVHQNYHIHQGGGDQNHIPTYRHPSSNCVLTPGIYPEYNQNISYTPSNHSQHVHDVTPIAYYTGNHSAQLF